jgi:adenylate cyclase class 2
MGRSSREIEVKLAFDSADQARAALAGLGLVRVAERAFEDNTLYDRAADSLKESGKMLRLRRISGRAIVTYKEPVPGEHRHKVRSEAEVEVDDPGEVERILAGLGFTPAFRYQKFRTHFRLGELDLLLDETPVGCFVELEGPPEAIDRAAAALGRTPADYLVETYVDIHERNAREAGREPGDLVFRPGSGPET